MKTPPPRRHSLRSCLLALAAGALGSTFTGLAMAGCGSYQPMDAAPPEQREAPLPLPSALMHALYRPGAGQFVRVADDRDAHESSIVGTWRFTFISDGRSSDGPPAGVVLDFGTAQWHSDGTEFMISGGRPPSTGDVCMGAWQQTGRNTYKLKHLALGWGSSDSTPTPVSPAAYLGPSVIAEEVTLNRAGNRFEGTVTIDVYKTDETTLVAHISGKVIASRITVD